MFSQNRTGSSYSRPRGSFRRTRRPQVEWSHSSSPSQRRGEGVRYGSLHLTPSNHTSTPTNNPSHFSSQINDLKLKIVVLGGNEEVGKNMTLIEYGEDIILIDMGIQFAEVGMLGVDGCVPDLTYLRGKEHRVRGILITHMHTDHIGGIPYLLPKLPNVPIFSAPLTLAMIAKKLEYTPEIKADLRAVDEASILHLGSFTIRFLGVSHSVPAAMGIVIETPVGKIVHTGDFKLDLNPTSDEEKRIHQSLVDLGRQHILALMADSTNAEIAGHQVMEREIEHDLDQIFKEHSGRLIFGMISTNVERLGQIITCAEKHGRRVFIGGSSLKATFEVAQQLGYLKPHPTTMIDVGQLHRLPPHKVIAIFPGAQGETNGAFYKLADGKQRDTHIQPGDTVIFSSSVIPGNERSVQFITDKFLHRGAKVLNCKMLDIHSGGHARHEDLKEVVRLIKPKYLIPIEGHHSFLHAHGAAARATGFPKEHILIARNAQVIEADTTGTIRITDHFLPNRNVFVKGGKIGLVDEDTLRERRQIGEEGVLVISRQQKPSTRDEFHIESYGIHKNSLKNPLHQHIKQFMQNSFDLSPRFKQRLADFLEQRFGIKPLIILTDRTTPDRTRKNVDE